MAIIEKIYLKENGVWNQKRCIDLYTSELKKDKKGISFISSEGDARLTDDDIKGFCHMKFKANLVVEGIDINNLTEGKLLQIGDAVIEITEVEKDCFPDCPIIKKLNTLCLINKQIFFGRILKKGIIKKGDNVMFM